MPRRKEFRLLVFSPAFFYPSLTPSVAFGASGPGGVPGKIRKDFWGIGPSGGSLSGRGIGPSGGSLSRRGIGPSGREPFPALQARRRPVAWRAGSRFCFVHALIFACRGFDAPCTRFPAHNKKPVHSVTDRLFALFCFEYAFPKPSLLEVFSLPFLQKRKTFSFSLSFSLPRFFPEKDAKDFFLDIRRGG